MRRLVLVSLVSSLFWVALVGAAAPAAPAATPKPRTHGNALSGTVVRVDDPHKLLVVRSGGRETSLVMTPATSVHGGPLNTGQRVAVRWLEKDGKHVATSVRVEPAAVAGATATPTAVGGQP
jgi:hypothetical protein